MEYLDFDMDIIIRALTAFVSFAIVGRICIFKARPSKKLGLSLLAWFLVLFCFLRGVEAIVAYHPPSISTLGILFILMISVFMNEGNVSFLVRRRKNELVKKTVQ